jgi:DNA-binding NarL/FixJ family response regulator
LAVSSASSMTRAVQAKQNGQVEAALIVAADGPRAEIANGLHGLGLEPAIFDSVDALHREVDRGFSVILQWVADTSSATVAQVAPIRARFASAPIVMVCPDIERWEMRSALAVGVAGVVLFDDLDSALGPCVRAVLAGQACVPKGHWRQIEPPALSAREKQILGLVVMGYMNSEIAAQLFLAESTVKSHLSSAFGKLGVRSRNEATNLILDPDRGLGMGILAIGASPVDAGTQKTA